MSYNYKKFLWKVYPYIHKKTVVIFPIMLTNILFFPQLFFFRKWGMDLGAQWFQRPQVEALDLRCPGPFWVPVAIFHGSSEPSCVFEGHWPWELGSHWDPMHLLDPSLESKTFCEASEAHRAYCKGFTALGALRKNNNRGRVPGPPAASTGTFSIKNVKVFSQ